VTWSNAALRRTVAFLLLLLSIPGVADAAGWVLVHPPRDEKGNYLPNVSINRYWTQLAAFDTAAQCEAQRMVEINFWAGHMEKAADRENKEWLKQRWRNEFLIRCMPYDLWWKSQQPGN
jgi:hypothetical protein